MEDPILKILNKVVSILYWAYGFGMLGFALMALQPVFGFAPSYISMGIGLALSAYAKWYELKEKKKLTK